MKLQLQMIAGLQAKVAAEGKAFEMCSESSLSINRNASHASVTNKEFIFHISWPLSLTVKVKMCKVGTLRSAQ